MPMGTLTCFFRRRPVRSGRDIWCWADPTNLKTLKKKAEEQLVFSSRGWNFSPHPRLFTRHGDRGGEVGVHSLPRWGLVHVPGSCQRLFEFSEAFAKAPGLFQVLAGAKCSSVQA